ncbi:MAG TPA: deoxyguanosinetriphosphate triphosphohydrolase [Firmicutes bacterium]|nr:deoxyguanosinetriphosphate triphosphohydrolase [Bacillota bacterium]
MAFWEGIREATEAWEDSFLSPRGVRSARSRGRLREEEPCPVRTAFQRDRDRIIHSKAFRRLKHKTQVFITPEGDHYRTRLTHTLEVAQIARTIARALRLNEDLTEAIALGHDLGHTPFGHAGEAVLQEVHPGGFRHHEQSLRVVDVLENGGKGLNLTWEVRDGILCHVPERSPATLEGQVVQLADRVAFLNHDIDDAIRGGVLAAEDIPAECREVLGTTHSGRISLMVRDIIATSWGKEYIGMSPPVAHATDTLYEFMFERVYTDEKTAKREEAKARRLLAALYQHYLQHPQDLYGGFGPPEGESLHQAVCDYVAGMTDRYAIAQYRSVFLPAPWA